MLEFIVIPAVFAICGVINFFLMARDMLCRFGEFTDLDKRLLFVISLFGPFALFWGLLLTLERTTHDR